jgi:hypothetical protein
MQVCLILRRFANNLRRFNEAWQTVETRASELPIIIRRGKPMADNSTFRMAGRGESRAGDSVIAMFISSITPIYHDRITTAL